MVRTYVSLAVTIGLGATVMFLFPYHAVTPGTLREGHHAQKNDCFSCHTLLAGAPAAKCVACHRPGEIGLRTVKGAALPAPRPKAQLIHRVPGAECARCHSEHGSRFGANAPRRFAHELLPLATASGCVACHSEKRPPDALHAAVSISTECSTCHDTKGWKPATYNHDRSFRFDGNHPPRCADCHRPGKSLKEYSCTGCHEHALDRMERKHREEGITNLEKCRRCHPSGNEHDTIGEGKNREEGEEERD